MRGFSFYVTVAYLTSIIVCGQGAVEWKRANLETLRLVHVLMRHGERNPAASFPRDPYKNDRNYWPGGYRQLTKKGVKQAHELGEYLRHRYDGFISRDYDQKELSAWSSDTERTIRSGLSALRGLYPKYRGTVVGSATKKQMSGDGSDNDGEASEVVPIRTVSKRDDNYLEYGGVPCPAATRLEEEQALGSKEHSEWESKVQGLIKAAVTNMGLKSRDKETLLTAFDYLNIQKHQNKVPFNWTTPEMIQLGADYLYFIVGSETKTFELKRFRSILHRKILESMEQKLKGASEAKLILYSAHDRTIMSYLNILELYNNIHVPYAAAVIVELHQSSELAGPVVEIHYRNDSSLEPFKLEMQHCPNPCELSTLQALLKPLFLDDFFAACNTSSSYMSLFNPLILILLIFVSLGISV